MEYMSLAQVLVYLFILIPLQLLAATGEVQLREQLREAWRCRHSWCG